MVELGHAVEIQLDDDKETIIEWPKRKYKIYSNVEGNALFIAKTDKRKGKTDLDINDEIVKRGIKLYDDFKDYAPSDGGWISPKNFETIEKKSRCRYIIYHSDKWNPGRAKGYIHHFGAPNPIVRFSKKTKFCTITGGKIKITKRGIEG